MWEIISNSLEILFNLLLVTGAFMVIALIGASINRSIREAKRDATLRTEEQLRRSAIRRQLRERYGNEAVPAAGPEGRGDEGTPAEQPDRSRRGR